MAFSEAEFQAAIDKINAGMSDLSAKIGEVEPTVQSAVGHWYVPDVVKDAIVALGKKILEIAQWIWDKFVELLKGVAAPVMMFVQAWRWQEFRGDATEISGQLKDTALSVDDLWTGDARDAYVKAIKPQSDAAARTGAVADKLAFALGICAAAGLAFYVALGVILVKFIAAMVAALVALGSAVFSWAGAALIVEEAGVNTGLIIAAVSTLMALLGAQAQQMVSLHGEAVDGNAFPGGHWPNATTAQYSDATVTDGDADWSLAH